LEGEVLAELRKDSGMSQKELGKVLSVSSTTISAYERNKTSPSDEIKIEIAKLFNVSLDYLLGVSKEKIELNWQNVLVLHEHFTDEVREEMLEYARFRSASISKKRKK